MNGKQRDTVRYEVLRIEQSLIAIEKKLDTTEGHDAEESERSGNS